MVQSRKKKSATRKKSGSDENVQESPVPERAQHSSVTVNESGPVFERVFGEVEDYAILLLDAAGTIVTWNKGAEKIGGYPGSEMAGKNCRIFFTREDKEINLSGKLLEEARKNGHANYEGWVCARTVRGSGEV